MRSRLSMMLFVTVLASVSPVPAAASASSEWTPVTPAIPRPDTAWNVFVNDVAALSPTDVWVVGDWWQRFGHPIAARWDGTSWHSTSPPDSTAWADQRLLEAVDAVSAQDVWAVGSHFTVTTNPEGSIERTTPLAIHYDGAAWSTVPTPATAGYSGAFTDIDMVSTEDGWAVGYSEPISGTGVGVAQPLVMRWQSGQWVEVPVSGGQDGGAVLAAVHVRSANDVWAVGSQGLERGRSTLIMHWDGIRWSRVVSPNVGTVWVENSLLAVVATSAVDVWAVGTACDESRQDRTCRPLALRLSAGQWRTVPVAGETGTHLTDLVVRPAGAVWAVGYDVPIYGPHVNHVVRWDGQQFAPVSTAPAAPAGPIGPTGALASALTAATVIPDDGELWAVGWTAGPGGRFDGQVTRH